MFTEHSLRQYPSLVKALMGIAAEQYWEIVAYVSDHLAEYEASRQPRPDRQRAVGGGRHYRLPLARRVALVLTYVRLHIPQATVAALFGATQADVSRELRRLLPLIQSSLPGPMVWQVLDTDTPPDPTVCLALADLTDGRVLIDATEQRVSRPGVSDRQRAYYSGKKKAFTLKTQFVTDGEHPIVALSDAVAGAEHDKALSDDLQTVERLPDGCAASADKGYQGLAAQVARVTVRDVTSGETQTVPRLSLQTPIKKPKGGELTAAQQAFNRALGSLRVRVEHCIGWAKNWAILATRFRCAHTIYTSIMRLVASLVNAQTHRWQAAKAANCA